MLWVRFSMWRVYELISGCLQQEGPLLNPPGLYKWCINELLQCNWYPHDCQPIMNPVIVHSTCVLLLIKHCPCQIHHLELTQLFCSCCHRAFIFCSAEPVSPTVHICPCSAWLYTGYLIVTIELCPISSISSWLASLPDDGAINPWMAPGYLLNQRLIAFSSWLHLFLFNAGFFCSSSLCNDIDRKRVFSLAWGWFWLKPFLHHWRLCDLSVLHSIFELFRTQLHSVSGCYLLMHNVLTM